MSFLQWILIAVVFGAIEVFTVGLRFLWLALSALLVAAGAALKLLPGLEGQLLVFAVFTLLFIIFTRPLVLKFFKSNDTASNVNALVGQHGISLSSIAPLEYGQVKVNGEVWTAVSHQEIEEATRVVVAGIEGVKLLVEKADLETNE
ncbi:MAG: NfeD family protein [Syntrophomonas sp.]|nr:NfeD family protein [Syntrophomonas sp.]